MNLIEPIPVGDGIDQATYFHDLLKESGMKKVQLGRILGKHPETVTRWKDDPPQYAIAYLELYVGVKRLL